jgi:hypothetical protein
MRCSTSLQGCSSGPCHRSVIRVGSAFRRALTRDELGPSASIRIEGGRHSSVPRRMGSFRYSFDSKTGHPP